MLVTFLFIPVIGVGIEPTREYKISNGIRLTYPLFRPSHVRDNLALPSCSLTLG